MTVERTRLPAAERRAQLLDVAADLFSEHGYHGTTTRAIADEAGVTEPILYRHFEGKRDLFLTLLDNVTDRTLETWQAAVADADDPLAALETVAADYPKLLDRLRREYRVVHRALSESEESDAARVLRNHYDRLQAFFADLLRDGQKAGVIRRDIDADLAAWEWVSVGLAFGITRPLGLRVVRGRDFPGRMLNLLLDQVRA